MINSEDTKTIKELVTGALLQVTTNMQETLKICPIVEKAFDIVIKEMKQGNI